eukprot:TRINITY_DN14138_c0_g1_i1.p4 TRINITY_DN14138_c0_g1~~TRINITY_DN14138_c0_g1_i1.p4  ORF type:complete len:241 (+),score=62.83 TRINITY_DN14138_c0_g1_i1:2188-2910(+)
MTIVNGLFLAYFLWRRPLITRADTALYGVLFGVQFVCVLMLTINAFDNLGKSSAFNLAMVLLAGLTTLLVLGKQIRSIIKLFVKLNKRREQRKLQKELGEPERDPAEEEWIAELQHQRLLEAEARAERHAIGIFTDSSDEGADGLVTDADVEQEAEDEGAGGYDISAPATQYWGVEEEYDRADADDGAQEHGQAAGAGDGQGEGETEWQPESASPGYEYDECRQQPETEGTAESEGEANT